MLLFIYLSIINSKYPYMKDLFKRIFIVLSLFAVVAFFTGCGDDDDDDTTPPSAQVVLTFEHYFDTNAVEFDKMQYTNEAGNDMEFTVIQWFISDLTLYMDDGSKQELSAWTYFHYIDTDIPSTLTWNVEDPVTPGNVEKIEFIFGIRGEKNTPYSIVNYPENAMFWPFHLGGNYGGYHYMKMNGFWLDNSVRKEFLLHLGVGQEQDSNGVRLKDKDGNFIFVQNWFTVTLPSSSFTIADKQTKEIAIRMNIEEWLTNPHTYDFKVWGGETMENQAALKTLKENGSSVFSIGHIKDL